MNIVITGGTLSKVYNPKTGSLIFNSSIEKILQDFFQSKFLTIPTRIGTWGLKDSRNITDKDRSEIMGLCVEMSNMDFEKYGHVKPFIIIHGTDALSESAAYFYKNNKITAAPIIITGSYIPLSVSGSEAEFNLGYSYACGQLYSKGVYVALNGKCLDASKPIVKRPDRCLFVYAEELHK